LADRLCLKEESDSNAAEVLTGADELLTDVKAVKA
jgi:hypothetical protein